jgi:predicted HTH domain antitoxin
MSTVSFEVPDNLFELFDSPEEASGAAKEAFVLHLLRESRISQGKAAELLGISREAMIDLAARERIPVGPLSAEDLRAEVEESRRMMTATASQSA